MRLRLSLDGVDFSDVTELASLSITQDSTQAISTAQVRLFQQGRGAGAAGRYDEAHYDEAIYGWSVDEWQEIRIWDEHSGQTLFGGFVLGMRRQPAGPHLWFQCNASDYGILLDRRLITKTWAAGTPDSQILTEALAGVPELTVGSIETIVADLGELEFKDQRIRDLFDAVCVLTGGEYYVSYGGRVNYYRSGTFPAPFDLSDDPPGIDGIGTIAFTLESYAHDFSDGANAVKVLGAVTPSGEVVGYAEDAASIAAYGRLEVPIANRQITDVVMAALDAQTQVAERKQPKESLQVSVRRPGMMRGQTINVYSLRLGIFRPFLIRTLEIVAIAPDHPAMIGGLSAHVLKYTATLGARPPDTVYQLRRMQRWPIESPKLPFTGATAQFRLEDGREVVIRGGIITEVRNNGA